jgi:hypothetical protein
MPPSWKVSQSNCTQGTSRKIVKKMRLGARKAYAQSARRA